MPANARDEALALLREVLLAEIPALRVEQMVPEAALVDDLGLDSIALVGVMVALEKRLGRSVDLLPWLSTAQRSGDFTLGSAAAWIAEHRT